MRRLPIHPQFVALCATLVALAACGGDGAAVTNGDEPSARTYQVRGVLQSLPDGATGAGQLRIHHEAIPDLVGAGGEVEGMASMSMPFPVAEELDLTGLAVGDPVRFDLRVDWEAARPVAITTIGKLPAGTELALD
jgi:Cu/Ag efflux protein CusF